MIDLPRGSAMENDVEDLGRAIVKRCLEMQRDRGTPISAQISDLAKSCCYSAKEAKLYCGLEMDYVLTQEDCKWVCERLEEIGIFPLLKDWMASGVNWGRPA